MPVVSQRAVPHDHCTQQLRGQRGWSADDVPEFLRLNRMVSTFGWSEILAEALDDRDNGLPHSQANTRLLAHTVERVFRWQRFHQDRNMVPALTSSLSEEFAAFTEWCDVETRAANLLVLWEERDLASGAPPLSVSSQVAGRPALVYIVAFPTKYQVNNSKPS